MDHKESDSDHESDLHISKITAAAAVLSDFLLDDIMPQDIYLGDDNIDEEEAKDDALSVRFFKAIQRVCRRALPAFVDALDDGLVPGEYMNAHFEAHEEYLGIVESFAEEALAERTDYASYREFVDHLGSALDFNPGRLEAYVQAQELMTILDIIAKFSNFAESMRLRAVQVATGSEDFEFGRRS